ncbi:hypothetical protein RFI_27768 [Reticulomyxa filosa]|uniref:Uncharacterized protein n=1 Tax=Reticulomyxa filosa TaxID=46433 RepID=X6M819_RETFI|nr:hypothetical protein RFI_27768 [Reticulomyxa filosa]|eukprot:ETO09607.1 hypothetical protein RFI_27768 [Reticulomyxa filosa]
MTELIERICNELLLEMKDWIQTYVDRKPEDVNTYGNEQQVLNKLVKVFRNFGDFYESVWNCRLLSAVFPGISSGLRSGGELTEEEEKQGGVGGTSQSSGSGWASTNPQFRFRSNPAKDPLQLLWNVSKWIRTLLYPYYRSFYFVMEKICLYSLFTPLQLSALHASAQSEPDIRARVQWFHEHAVKLLSCVDISMRLQDSLSIVLQLIDAASQRCLVISHGALIKEFFGLFDGFLNEYISKVDQLLAKNTYFEFEKDLVVSSSKKGPAAGGDEKEHGTNASEKEERKDTTAAIGSSLAESSTQRNWIFDLSQSFELYKQVKTLQSRLIDFVQSCNDRFQQSIVHLRGEIFLKKEKCVCAKRVIKNNK